MLDIHDQIKMLTRIGLALTSEHDLNRLLELIVREARALTNSDAGSLYIKEGDYLQFVVSQNETLGKRLADRGEVMEKFKPFPVKISNESISGYAALNAEIVNIPDVRQIPADAPYSWNPSFDEKNDYLTKSMLSAPMINHEDEVIGVLQLINAQKWNSESQPLEDRVIAYDQLQEELVSSLASQAAVAISNARLTADIKQAHLDTIYRLSIAAEYKDQDTASHIKRMSLYSKILAEGFGMTGHDVEMVLYASPMHDVGKLGVPDAVLLKPGRLDPEERKIIEAHTIYGGKILEGASSEILEWSRVIALSHHEKWDGSGYPYKLTGDDIPITGRIVAVADVFDALTSQRPYKKAWTLEDAKQEIIDCGGSHFDPALVEVFRDNMDDIAEVHASYQD